MPPPGAVQLVLEASVKARETHVKGNLNDEMLVLHIEEETAEIMCANNSHFLYMNPCNTKNGKAQLLIC